ncbi:MAG: decarboxylating NADP(+)-dependent phosphogluconate dehydrogenase [Sphaerochaetaceae bacterium]|jgi:6-phosphogluconate dehydrogenase
MEVGDIGVIGLAVMGQNLILNMNDNNYSVVVYNRTTSKVDEFLKGAAKGRDTIIGSYSIKELISKLKRPRKVLLMVKAGEVVDSFIEQIIPFLEKGDLIIDGGNSHYPDTNRRTHYLAEKGILFIGAGVSGGEEGARRGPSIMPGGNAEGWPLIKDIFQDIAAKVGSGEPCCEWVGNEGSGHFVKMVHNGIEYGDIQLITEAYDIMHSGLGLTHDELHEVFSEWNEGELDSYLIEITRDIMAVKDDDGLPMVTKILDRAGQKGTGKWTSVSSFDLGSPTTMIAEAVYARIISSLKDQRVVASKILGGPERKIEGDKKAIIEDLRKAVYASKIVSYAQGFMLLKDASEEYGWDLNYGEIALMWRDGCIIRSVFLDDIMKAYKKDNNLGNLLFDSFFVDAVTNSDRSWRKTISRAVEAGIPIPALSSALSFYDAYRSERLPTNLLQAMRDYFGAHTYERVDRPRGEFYHTNWTGTGGDVSSTTYDV